MSRTTVLAVTFACVVATGAAAQTVGPPKVSISIYNSDLALVEETRTLDLAAGRQKLEFQDVSAAIRPETVSLVAPGLSIVEQNFDYDLLSPDKLMEKAVGKQVQIVRTNPGDGQQTTETATVLAVNDGVVLRIGDRIEVLRDDGVPTRVIFDKIPDNLRARPILSVTVAASQAGPRQAQLSYLTTGLAWKADYVALFDEKKQALDLQGWITLTNTSGTGFADAETQLVAGAVNLMNGQRPYPRNQGGGGLGGMEPGEGGGVADYHVYPLAERTTIAANQTKQVSFLDAQGVRAKKSYRFALGGFGSYGQPASVDVLLDFSNAKAAGLGAPLPAGVMRVYMRDVAGDPKFVGESPIYHTPQGSDLSIKTGQAFDVTIQPTLVTTDVVPGATNFVMTYLLRNAGATPATVELIQGSPGDEFEVVRESQASRRLDASQIAWDVAVPAGGETLLRATFSTATRR